MTKSKLKTPDWIIEGYDSPAEYARHSQAQSGSSEIQTKAKDKGKSSEKKEKGKTFKIRVCPKCESDEVVIALSNLDSEEESNTGKEWECRKCKWRGENVKEKDLTEDQLMEHLDKKGEEVA